jgi:hypothetical protein
MTEKYSFFGSAEGDIRQYDQTDYAEVYKRYIKTGVFPSVENELVVAQTVPARLAVQVNTGQAYIEGYWYGNTSIKEIDLPAADAVHPRIDRIVLRLDVVNERKITAEYLQGTAAVAPVAPDLTRTDQIYEISLAQVRVNAGATSILNANITDERSDLTLCGWAIPYVTPEQIGAYTKVGVENWVKSFGLGDVAKQQDWNTIDKSGFYQSNLNSPINNATYIGFHSQHQPGFATQIAARNGDVFFRTKESNVWSTWDQITSKSKAPSFLNIDSINDGAVSGETAYPIGISEQSVGNAPGYPHTHGMTVNLKVNNTRFTQLFFRPGATAPDVGMWFRHYYTGVGWSKWFEVLSTGHAAYMSKSSQASISPSTRTKVGLDSGLAYGDMVISTSANRFTVPKDGSYQVNALATVYIDSNKYAELSLYKNGSLYRHIGRTEATNTAYQQVTGIDISGAFAGDYFELYVYHTGAYSAAALNFRMTMAYLGGL